MGEMRIRIEDEALLTRISDLAKLHNRSVDAEAEALLQLAVPVRPKREDLRAIAAKIKAMTPKGVKQTDVVEMLREDRSR
jgi:plasmid stability protein